MNFHGEAQDFDEEEHEYQTRGLPLWVILTAIVLLALSVISAFNLHFW